MDFKRGLFIGLILGWLLEWGFDSWWHRRETGTRPELATNKREPSQVQSRLKETELTVKQPPEKPVPPTVSPAQQQDQFEQVKGIGPVYARRLHEAGIDTFSQLAGLTPEQIREIVQVKGQNIEPEQWIIQAGELAEERAGKKGSGGAGGRGRGGGGK